MADLQPVVQKPFVWEATTARNTVNDLYKIMVDKTTASIQWYLDKKRKPAAAAQLCRNAAVFLTVMGGLCPILKTAFPKSLEGPGFTIGFADAGYIFLAFALAVVLVDKYAGYSTAWIRYIKANLRLEGMLQQFQYDWQITCAQLDFDVEKKEGDKVVLLVTKLKDFAKQVSTEIEAETQEWVTEFQNSLAMLAKASERDSTQKKDQGAAPPPPPPPVAGAGQKLGATGDTPGHG